MRIGIDVRGMQTAGGSAGRGIGRYVTDLVLGLAWVAKEHSLILIGFQGRELPDALRNAATELVEIDGPVFHEMSRPWYLKIPKVRVNPTARTWQMERVMAQQQRSFEAAVNAAKLDVLQLPTAVDLGSYPEGRFNCPTAMTFLDAIPLVLREAFYDQWDILDRHRYDRQLANLRNADAVVAISRASADDAIRFAGVAPEKVCVVYPSVPIPFESPIPLDEAAETRRKYGLSRPYFLFCSAPDPHKNLPGVAQSYQLASPRLAEPHHLVLVASESANAVQYARNLLSEEDLVVTGRVSDRDLVALFQGATALLSPSLIEGFGLPALQAMRCGVPAIVGDHGSQREVVEGVGIVVDPRDPESIAEAMVRVANDAAYRDQIGRAGQARAIGFRLETQARQLLDVYESLYRGRSLATPQKAPPLEKSAR